MTRLLLEGDYSCIVRKGGELRTFTRRGVADLYDLLRNDPSFLRGASVADKVVGKAAAALMILGDVRHLHAVVISRPALELLRRARIEVTCDTLTEGIANRDRTGLCPLELRCSAADTAAACLPLIGDFLRQTEHEERLRHPHRELRLLGATLLALAATWNASGGNTDTLRTNRPHPIEEVVVTGTRQAADPRTLPVTVTVVDRGRIEQAGRASLLPTLTEQVPGLFVTGRGVMGYGVSTGAAGGMSLRGIGGSPTTGVLVLVDGQPQYMGLMGHPIADACQSMLAERVEVVRGPASTLYGSNASGGVINIVTRRMRQDGVRADLHAGAGSYGTAESEVAVRFRHGRLTGAVTGSYDRTDGHRADMGFEQYGGFAKLGCRIGKAWEATADLNLTHFNASNPGSVSAPLLDNDSRITRGRGSLTLRNDYGRTSGAVSLFYNWGIHRIDDGYSPGAEPTDYRFRSQDMMAGLSLYQTLQLLPGNLTTVGLDLRKFGGKAQNRYLDGRPDTELADKSAYETAGYIDFRQPLARWLTIDAGVRIDHHSHTGTEWVPQGGMSVLLPHDLMIKAVVGKGFRFPTIREMYMFPPQNPDLKAERLVSCELSLAQRLAGGRLSYTLDIYYIDGDNTIVLVPVDGRAKYLNTGRIENWGVEADIRWSLAPSLSLSANYSWLHMEHPVTAAPEHKLFCGIDFAKRRWSGSTGVLYVRGLYTQVDPDIRERFVLWNARVQFRASRRIELFVRGENLLARRYEINAGYPMPKATALGGVNIHF